MSKKKSGPVTESKYYKLKTHNKRIVFKFDPAGCITIAVRSLWDVQEHTPNNTIIGSPPNKTIYSRHYNGKHIRTDIWHLLPSTAAAIGTFLYLAMEADLGGLGRLMTEGVQEWISKPYNKGGKK